MPCNSCFYSKPEIKPTENDAKAQVESIVLHVLNVMGWNASQADVHTLVTFVFQALFEHILGRWLQLMLPNGCEHKHNELQVYLDFKVRDGKLTLLTGAGVTKALTKNQAEDWPMLLERVRDELSFDQPSSDFIRNSPDAAAQYIVDNIKDQEEKLENCLKRFTQDAIRKVDNDCHLPKLLANFKGPILMFNYDEAPEYAFYRSNQESDKMMTIFFISFIKYQIRARR